MTLQILSIVQNGSDDEAGIVRKSVKFIFSDDVLLKYSWKGTAEKNSFSNLVNTKEVILDAIRTKYPNFERSVFEKRVKQWIRHAEERLRPKNKFP